MPPEDRKKNSDSSTYANTWQDRERESTSPWAIVLFGLVAATATTVAAARLRTTVDWFYNQLRRSQPFSSWTSTSGSSSRGSFREEARSRYNRRMQEEYEDEMERVERIRRMQSVFNRERSKHKKYESWREHGPTAYQNFQREDWYWKSDKSYCNQRTNFRPPPRDGGNYAMSHHYSILGLDRCRAKPYSETEIKTAFRAKAMEFHPDQNQNNKVAAEAKFKEVMTSYEAIKLERKNGKS